MCAYFLLYITYKIALVFFLYMYVIHVKFENILIRLICERKTSILYTAMEITVVDEKKLIIQCNCTIATVNQKRFVVQPFEYNVKTSKYYKMNVLYCLCIKCFRSMYIYNAVFSAILYNNFIITCDCI